MLQLYQQSYENTDFLVHLNDVSNINMTLSCEIILTIYASNSKVSLKNIRIIS